MSEQNILRPETTLVPARRRLLVRGGQVLLSAGAIAILAGCESMASSKPASAATAANDIQVLNTALGLEYEGIAAYQVGAESGLLQKPVLGVAVKFQDHHKKHAELLASTVKKLGGTPVMPQSKYDFPTGNLKTQEDVLRFAAGLEQGAAQAYYGAVPVFANKDLSAAAASIMADEAMHWAVLRSALGEDPIPTPFAIS
ncbi:exported protein [Hypericibacter adhaerens]|jgi:bacterioferritin (cytochrome b1)|uniref:Exported protein n=1 Tax=Hypericibacter adhaerens TaxID=2602016 RepID=A0A5J6MSM9_9PROT|nr:ferritin-like domain-containing protein [Hypericibacter adhaerens]QEX20313.1 exported protein [Hypericibacter adhaerens]